MAATIRLTPSFRNLPPGIGIDEFRASVKVAAAQWTEGCDALEIIVEPSSGLWTIRDDDVNLVAFRTTEWCRNLSCGSGSTYRPKVAGVTTAHARVGGDIELNAKYFSFHGGAGDSSWKVPSSSGRTDEISLDLVLVHEIGHVLGLPDRCEASGHRPVPDGTCEDDYSNSVMHAPSRLFRPSPKDREEVCALFTTENAERQPTSYAPERPDPSGIEPSSGTALLFFVATVAIGLLWKIGHTRVRRGRTKH